MANCFKYLAASIVILAALPGLQGEAYADLIDDFSDGNDVGWTHFDGLAGTPWGPTIYDASSGQYAISSSSALPPLAFMVPTGALWTESISDPFYSNGFLRTMIRADNDSTNLAAVMRFDVTSGNGYAFGVDTAADTIFIVRVDGGSPTLLADAPFILGPRRDYILETHVSGPDRRRGAQITMKIWGVQQPEPTDPQLGAFDATYMTGAVGLLVTNPPGGPGGPIAGSFDDVYFYVPEPATLLFFTLGALALARRR